jgi:hypothetical protein
VSTAGHANSRAAIGTAAAITVGALVALLLGVYGHEHTPTGQSVALFGFPSLIQMKFWLAVVAGVLACAQLVTALWMYGRLGLRVPRRLGLVHRSVGAVALLASLPVAYHCLWSLGFGAYDARVLVHSLLGCVLYGAFVTKVIGLHSGSAPGWLVPVAAGLLFAALIIVVLTSAGWYLATQGLPTSTSVLY